jgi:putative flippase GtrA
VNTFERLAPGITRFAGAIAGARFVRYLLANGMTVLVSAIIRNGLSYVAPYLVTVVAAYCLSIVFGYHFLRLLSVFPETGRSMFSDIMRIWPVTVFSLLALTAISSLFRLYILPSIGLTWHVDDVAYLIGLASTPLPNYLLMRWLLAPRDRELS